MMPAAFLITVVISHAGMPVILMTGKFDLYGLMMQEIQLHCSLIPEIKDRQSIWVLNISQWWPSAWHTY